MGMLAETAIIDYYLSFLDQGKTNFRFPFPLAANKWNFAVFIFCLQQTNRTCCSLFAEFGNMET
jgi:hypothetical protein